MESKIWSSAICRCLNRGDRIRFDHMVGCWKWYIPGAMKLNRLWLPVSPATDVPRGQMRANLIHLDQLYSIPKYRIPGTPARVFPRKVKLPESSKFRPPIFGQTAWVPLEICVTMRDTSRSFARSTRNEFYKSVLYISWNPTNGIFL